MSGPITVHSTAPEQEGRTGIFRVQDNGEGSNDPVDQMTLLRTLPPGSTMNCYNFGFQIPFFPIEAGNIQVRP